jgi:hypothetical protein
LIDANITLSQNKDGFYVTILSISVLIIYFTPIKNEHDNTWSGIKLLSNT